MNIPAADDFAEIARRIKEIAQEREPSPAPTETPKPAADCGDEFMYDGGVYW